MPAALKRMILGFGNGSTLNVVDSPYGCIGSGICWENYIPMLRMAIYSKIVALFCAPTVDDRETWLPTMQQIAMKDPCFVLTAVQFLEKMPFQKTYAFRLEIHLTLFSFMEAALSSSPFGKVLAGPFFSSEIILTSTLDLYDIGRVKFDLDVVGHYSRPDVFQLIINKEPQQTIIRKPSAN